MNFETGAVNWDFAGHPILPVERGLYRFNVTIPLHNEAA